MYIVHPLEIDFLFLLNKDVKETKRRQRGGGERNERKKLLKIFWLTG